MALISSKVGNTGQRQRRRSGLTCLTWPQACALAGALAGLLNAGMAFAQAATPYPIKPVRFVIPFPPGGGNDLLGRAYAERLGERFGHTFIVDNRGGASTVIAAELVARAPADGYTLLLAPSATLAALPNLRANLPYDPIRDFEPVSLISISPYLLVAHPNVAAKSVKELVALAKSKPGNLNYASPGHGTSNHLAAELFKSMAGADLTHVPYKGTGPAVVDLLGGQISVMFASAASVRQFVVGGRLRALGISTIARSPAMPEIPTIAESGVPGYDTYSWGGIVAPRGTPQAIISRLSTEVAIIVKQSDMRDKLIAQGLMPQASTPQAFAEHIRLELAHYRKFIRAAGIRE